MRKKRLPKWERVLDILEERLKAYYHGVLSFTDAQREIEKIRKEEWDKEESHA